jgi:hypothetical protein
MAGVISRRLAAEVAEGIRTNASRQVGRNDDLVSFLNDRKASRKLADGRHAEDVTLTEAVSVIEGIRIGKSPVSCDLDPDTRKSAAIERVAELVLGADESIDDGMKRWCA